MKSCDLRCEYLEHPLGIDVPSPRLSWKLKSSLRCDSQSAYRIVFREESAAGGKIIHDTGKIESSDSIQVKYDGPALKSCQRYGWELDVWDREGKKLSPASKSFFETGMLDSSDWSPAKWIGRDISPDSEEALSAPLFRKEFEIGEDVFSARVYLSGLGYYELTLNGEKIGNQVLDPGFTRYDRRVLYSVHDIAPALRRGRNVFGVTLGNGFYNVFTKDSWKFNDAPWRSAPKFIIKAIFTKKDGSREELVSDETWKRSKSPITFNGIRHGETYDARIEKNGWDKADFDESDWESANHVEAPKGVLSFQKCPPIRKTGELNPISLKKLGESSWLFDFGQSFAGWVRISASAKRGTSATIRYGEKLLDDGSFTQEGLDTHTGKDHPFQTDKYIFKGSGEETWEPRFTYHGFRYVLLEGLESGIGIQTLKGIVVHTDFKAIGSFKSSSRLLNKIQQNTLWSFRSNFHSIPTDCPHREKNGWTGDAHLAAEVGLLNFDTSSAYSKWLDDLHDEQNEEGALPGIVPTGGWGYSWGNGPCWDSAFILVAWYLYLYSGDSEVIRRHYGAFKKYFEFILKKRNAQGIVHYGLGDWAPPFGDWEECTVPKGLSLTAYVHRYALTLAKFAELLGKEDDAAEFIKSAGEIRDAINARYLMEETGIYANGSMSSQATALFEEVVPDQIKMKALARLIDDIGRHDWHLNCGIHTTKYLLRVLSIYGRTDIALKIATRTTYPSWGDWIRQGATTLWETWDGKASRNHIMLGDISAWFYSALAGIIPDPETPGFKHVIIRPHPLPDLSHATAETDTRYGRVKSSWRLSRKRLLLNVEIPCNTSASVQVPWKGSGDDIYESGQRASRAPGVKSLSVSKGFACLSLGAGKYSFSFGALHK